LKICVLVKEVPDAAVEKRIDPSTGRMDRSGEKNLNPYDTHAIEAAMQIREGGSVQVEEIVAVTMGPESAVRALHKAVSLGADRSVRRANAAARQVFGADVSAVLRHPVLRAAIDRAFASGAAQTAELTLPVPSRVSYWPPCW
jgi:electron transfer flavoprotein beta subunit